MARGKRAAPGAFFVPFVTEPGDSTSRQMWNRFVARQIELLHLPMCLVQMRLRGHALSFELGHFLAHLMLPARRRLFLRATPL